MLLPKALRASPEVVEALANRQTNFNIRLGVSAQIRDSFQAAQSASYAHMFRTQPAVRAVVEYIASNTAQLGLKLYERVSDTEREERGDHPAAETMRYPSREKPGEQFIFDLVADFCVYANAYALKLRESADGPLIMLSVPAHAVVVIGPSQYSIDSYRVYRSDGSHIEPDIRPEDMFHWRGYNPQDPRIGVSKLETLRQVLAEDSASQTASRELLESGLGRAGVIQRPLEAPEWSEAARNRFEEDWANRAKESAKKTPVLEEGMEFQESSISPKDAEMLAGREFTREEVARLYGMKHVPPETDEERQQFYSDVLPPLCEMLACYLNVQLLQAEYGLDDYYFEFNIDEKLSGDDRLKSLTSAAGAPIMTRNESRARLNLPAKPGGDELVTPMNVIVGGKPSVDVMPVQNPSLPSQDGDYREEAEAPKALPAAKATPLVPRRARADARRNNWARQYGEALYEHFRRQSQSVKSRHGERTKAVDSEKWNAELAADLLGISTRHFRSEGDQAAFRLASSFNPEGGRNYIGEKAAASAALINQATAADIVEKGFDDAFAFAREARAPAAGKGYATDIAAFATKAAVEQTQQPNRTITIDGGECEICAEYQGVWKFNEVPEWPSYHQAATASPIRAEGGKRC